MGTLGAGNHFIEVEVVDEVFDDEAARVMGSTEGCLTVMIHCGSRGFGHQICTDYVKSFQKAVKRYGIRLPDRELVCAPLDSPEGKAYEGAMRGAANYAFANRQVLAHFAREAFAEMLRGRSQNAHLHQVYDIAHNMGKTEEHVIDGKRRRVCVHRKGATRAFGPGFEGLPPEYRSIGQPVLVPGSMGTASWVLVGTEKSMECSLGSCCHGAGRTMSRRQAKRSINGGELRRELEEPRYQGPRGLDAGPRRGGARGLQGRRRGGRCGGRRRHRQKGRPPPPRRGRQGLRIRSPVILSGGAIRWRRSRRIPSSERVMRARETLRRSEGIPPTRPPGGLAQDDRVSHRHMSRYSIPDSRHTIHPRPPELVSILLRNDGANFNARKKRKDAKTTQRRTFGYFLATYFALFAS